jgi:hypothetical protein
MDIQLMTQYSVLGLTFTTLMDVLLVTKQDILFLQKKKQLMQFSTLFWRKKMASDHSKLLIKVLENFYDKNNVPNEERCDAESFFFWDDDNKNAWLDRYCEVWEKAMKRVQYV